MDSAILEKRVYDEVNEVEKEQFKISLPGSLTNVRERLIALSPAVIIGIIMGGLKAAYVSLLVGGGCLITYAIYMKVKKVEEIWPEKLFYYLILLLAIIPAKTTWWQSLLAGLGITFLWLIYRNKSPFNISLAIWLIIAFLGGENQIFGSKMQPEQMPFLKMYIANSQGGIGEFFLPALIAGGGYLLYKEVISWTLILSFIGTVMSLSFIGGDNPLMHLLSGSLILGVIFLIPDMKDLSRRMKLLYGIGGGVLALGIRYFGDFLTAVPLAILIMDWLIVIKLIMNYDDDNIIEQESSTKNHLLGGALLLLVCLGLVSAIFTSDANPLTEFFKAFDILSKFAVVIIFYLTIHKLSNPRIANYNFLQSIIATIVVMAVII